MKNVLPKMAKLGYFSMCFLFVMSVSAKAYLDPSTTTYIVQAVAGVAVAVGAVVVMYWRKAKKKVQKALKVDEHSNKEHEDDDILMKVDADSNDQQQAQK